MTQEELLEGFKERIIDAVKGIFEKDESMEQIIFGVNRAEDAVVITVFDGLAHFSKILLQR